MQAPYETLNSESRVLSGMWSQALKFFVYEYTDFDKVFISLFFHFSFTSELLEDQGCKL